MDNIGALIVPAAIALFAISIVARGIRIVQQAQTMIIERLGKYHRTLSSGVNLIIPIIDKPRAIDWHQVIVTPAGESFARHFRTDKIDLRETVYVFPRQNVITKDNVVVEIDALIYSQITDPVRATYEIGDLGIDQRVDLHHHVVLGDHVLAREDVYRLAQVDLVGAEMARERLSGRRDDHLVPVDRPRLVDDRDDGGHPGGEGAVVFAQALDDHRLSLLHDADPARGDRDREQRDRRRDDERADVVHRSHLLVHVQGCALDPHHHHSRARLERCVHDRRGAPVLTLHLHPALPRADRKSTRLNSSHSQISYAVFCLKK